MKECIFCKVDENDIIYSNDSVYAIYDNYPVSKGHILIIPFNHVETWFDADEKIKNDINLALEDLKNVVDINFSPDGYNIGINCGKASGQSIFHLHVHLIPRYNGDMKNPKGGVRGVIPSKQKY